MNDGISKKGKPGRSPHKRDQSIANAAVGQKLKAFYDDIAHQEVPDRFLDLLDQLDEASQKKPG